MIELPAILAGPILRRSSTREVTIWIATSQPQPDLTARIGINGRFTFLPAKVKKDEIKVGRNFYVYLLRLRSPRGNSFPSDKILFYKVGYPTFAGITPLGGSGQQEDTSYTGFIDPTFVLQSQGTRNLNAIYGSCRKMHGPGYDANRAADHKMKQTVGSVKDRPHALLLCGDQIYADDVPGLMIRHIQALAKALFGFDEFVPNLFPADIPVDGRTEVLRNYTQFTSGEDKNHLITFGEFCATYLLAWNDKLWPDNLPTLNEMLEEKKRMKMSPLAKINYPTIHKIQSQQCLEFKTGSKLMRRMLANVPSYMIFDDHEVTDDWNFWRGWVKANLHKKTARRIIANGIAAFWLFQGIGNSPKYFYDDWKRKVSRKKGQQKEPSSGHPLRLAFEGHIQHLKNLNKKTAKAFDKAFIRFRKWSFITNTRPIVLFTDNRTRRGKSRSQGHSIRGWGEYNQVIFRPNKKAALLMDRREMSRVRHLLNLMVAKRQPLIIVTPGPVYGLNNMEKVKQKANQLISVSPTKLDMESYMDNPHSFFDLIETLLTLRRQPEAVIFLSGDVHYGFSVKGMWDLNGRPGVMFAQFCSSAVKNKVHGVQDLLLTTFKNTSLKPSLNFWARSKHANGHGPAPTVRFYKEPSDPIVQLSHPKNEPLSFFYLELLLYYDFAFAEVFQFERANPLGLVEMRNNMGFLQLKDGVLNHHLMVWTGGPSKSLVTSEQLSHAKWPVFIKVD